MSTKEHKPLWTNYAVTWSFPDQLCGSVPKKAEMVEGWLDARKPDAIPPNTRTLQEVQEEVVATLLVDDTDDVEKRVWEGFQTIDGGLVMRGATVRAHMKDCARTVGRMHIGKIKGEAMLGWKITNGLYVAEYWIPILRPDGQQVVIPDGFIDKSVHAQTPRGPINALKRFDYVENIVMKFTFKVLSSIAQSDLVTVMEYGCIHGYAGQRSEAYGRYIFEICES